MDIFNILETFGVPVAMSVAFGFFIWKQNKWIQEDLKKDMDKHAERLEGIVIGLINAQKETQIKISEMNKSYKAIVEIMAWLSGNGLKEKFLKKKVEDDW